jgi:hypothetical protein
VVHEKAAVSTAVEFGLKSYEYYQVLYGLTEGDEVVLSDMRDFEHTKEVKLR